MAGMFSSRNTRFFLALLGAFILSGIIFSTLQQFDPTGISQNAFIAFLGGTLVFMIVLVAILRRFKSSTPTGISKMVIIYAMIVKDRVRIISITFVRVLGPGVSISTGR